MQGQTRIVRVEVFTLEMRSDGILHLHADGDKVITMELYRKMVNAVGEMTGGRKVPILCTTDELTMPDDEVKEFMVKPDSNPYSAANALIAPSLPQKIFSNLFIRIVKPARPVKMFRNKEDAIEWLKGYL